MLSLIVVFAMLVQCMSVIALNTAITACAREAARVATLEFDRPAAERAARNQVAHCQPDATLELVDHPDFIDATVSRRIRVLGLPRAVTMSSTASALKEPAW